MENPVISYIVPVYKVEDYLDRCVTSIKNQSLENIEIILVDDESPDECPKMCDEYAKNDPRIRVIHKKNGGLSDARNAGIKEAKGEYLTFVDSDDFIHEDLGKFLYELINKYDAQAAVGSIVDYYKDGPHNETDDESVEVFGRSEAVGEFLKGQKMPGSICGKLFKKELFDGIGFPVGVNYEDAYIGPEVLLRTEKVVFTKKQVYSYWHRPGSITTGKFTKRAFDVIKSYKHSYEVVKNNCPENLDAAKFRLNWAYFVVLDRMLHEKNAKKMPEYKKVVGYLKKHSSEIARCEYFQKSRRLAAVALKVGMPFYKVLWKIHEKRQEVSE